MSNQTQNPNPNDDQNQGDHEDAAALFTALASQDSDDSGQQRDENTLDSSEENDIDNEAEENEQDNNDEGHVDDDPWAQVDESLRNQFYTLQANHQKLQNDHRANAGRVQALNNKVSEYQAQLERQEQQGKPAGNGPTAEDLEGMTFEEVESEWPEVAGYLKKQLAQSRDQITQQLTQQFEERLNPLNEMHQQQQQYQQQQYVQTELQRLKQIHPDYQDIANDSKFHQWVNDQPDTVKAMAGSLHAADNIALLNLYKSSTGERAPKPAQSNLSDHATIPRKGSGRQIQTDPNNIDPVQLFTHLASKKK